MHRGAPCSASGAAQRKYPFLTHATPNYTLATGLLQSPDLPQVSVTPALFVGLLPRPPGLLSTLWTLRT